MKRPKLPPYLTGGKVVRKRDMLDILGVLLFLLACLLFWILL